MSDKQNEANTDGSGSVGEDRKSLRRSWRASGPVAKWTVSFAGVAAFSTVVYAIFAMLQWRVMSDTLNHERPWIGSTKQLVATDSVTKRIGAAALRVRNGGRSPAVNARFYARIVVGAPEQQCPTEENKIPRVNGCRAELPGRNGVLIIPNEEFTVAADLPDDVKARLDDLYNQPPKVSFYLVGCGDYTDSSKSQHFRTNFLMKITAPGNIGICEDGNDAR